VLSSGMRLRADHIGTKLYKKKTSSPASRSEDSNYSTLITAIALYRTFQEFQGRDGANLRSTGSSAMDNLRHTVWAPVQSVGLPGLADSRGVRRQRNSDARRHSPMS
jgi:hypothetical protein